MTETEHALNRPELDGQPRSPEYLLGFVLAAGYALAVATAVVSFTWPLTNDQGIFAWIGDVILGGGTPYHDTWDTKGPLGPFAYALSESLFGVNSWGIRVADQVANLFTIALAWRMVRPTCGRTIAHIAAIALWFMLLRMGHWDGAQPDTWAGMLAFAAQAVLTSSSAARLRLVAAAGGLLGLACLDKFFFAVFLLPLCYYEWRDSSASLRQVVGRIALMAASCAAVMAVALLWLWWRGGLTDYLEIQFDFNAAVHWLLQTPPTLGGLRTLFLDRAVILVWPLALFGLLSGEADNRRLKIALALMILCEIVLYFAQKKFFLTHLSPVFPQLVVLAAWGVHRLREIWGRSKNRPQVAQRICEVLTALFVVAIVTANWRPEFMNGWRFLAGSIAKTDYYDTSFVTARVPPSTILRLSDYLRTHTTPQDKVLVWGIQSEVNFLSGRKTPTRFGMNYPLIAKPDAAVCHRYRQEFLSDLIRQPPAYIVIIDHDKLEQLLGRTSQEHFEAFPEFAAFVTAHYELAETQPNYHLWRRSAAANLQ